MTQFDPLLSSAELQVYESSLKKAQKRESDNWTSDYKYALVYTLICMPIVYVLYVYVSLVLKALFVINL